MCLVVSQLPFNLEHTLSQGPVREASLLSPVSGEIYAPWRAGPCIIPSPCLSLIIPQRSWLPTTRSSSLQARHLTAHVAWAIGLARIFGRAVRATLQTGRWPRPPLSHHHPLRKEAHPHPRGRCRWNRSAPGRSHCESAGTLGPTSCRGTTRIMWVSSGVLRIHSEPGAVPSTLLSLPYASVL